MRKAIYGFFILTFGVLFIFSSAQAENFEEGIHYRELSELQPTRTGDKIEVVEAFWYRCPHCYNLEAPLIDWLKNIPDNAEFVTMPAIFADSWELHARVYYTFDALGITEQFHREFFNALHQERKRLNSVEAIAKWVEENGGPKASEFTGAFASFAVDSNTRNAQLMSQKYELTGVPSMIVGGKYVTTVTMAGSHERFFNVIDYLIDLVNEEKLN
ncbi:MAG: thiol:disulfide interchange protein DsbA [Parasphingorhabdus sp.]|jgi:thiol:disulfide interchange protein DsbA